MRRYPLAACVLAFALGGCAAPTPPAATPVHVVVAPPTYAERIAAQVRRNIVLVDDVPGNPVAEVDVWLDANGVIARTELAQSSGSPSWDRAVVHALIKTGRLPLDVDGHVPPQMRMAFRPKAETGTVSAGAGPADATHDQPAVNH